MNAKFLAVFLLLAAPFLAAQSSAPPANDPASASNASSFQDLSDYTLKQEVRNVIVDVTVTDKHGMPVTALDKSRFQIFENGVAQDIAFFEEHKADETAAPQPALNLPPDTHTNLVTAPPGPQLVLLLDALNTQPGQQSYVRAQALEYLKQIPAGTHMAIFTLGDKLQLIQGFTADPSLLKAALDGRSYAQFVSLDATGTTAASISSVRSSLTHWSNGSSDIAQELDINYTLDALNALSVYLSGIPGRKNLIWFAGTVPWTINPDFSLATSVTGRVDYTEALMRLANTMTAGRIAIYLIDAHALDTPGGYGPDNAPTAGAGAGQAGQVSRSGSGGGGADSSGSPYGGRGMGSTFGSVDLNSQMNEAANHMSMTNLSEATGGRAFYNSNGLGAAVAKVQEIAGNYYAISYAPKDKDYDGGVRQLAVKVSEPGLKLDYRRAYFAEDPANAAKRSGVVYSNALRGVMQRGAPDATQIPFTIQAAVAPVQPDPSRASDRIGDQAATLKGPIVRYDFHWKVNVKTLTFTPTANGLRHAEVDATVAAYDADGKVINNIYATLPLNLTDEQYNRLLRGGLPMKQTLDLPAGTVYLRAGVEDPGNGRTGATEFPFLVQPLKPAVARSSGSGLAQP